MKKSGYDSSVYDLSFFGNIYAVLGDQPLLWWLPISPPSGQGLTFVNEKSPLSKDTEKGLKGLRHKKYPYGGNKAKPRKGRFGPVFPRSSGDPVSGSAGSTQGSSADESSDTAAISKEIGKPVATESENSSSL